MHISLYVFFVHWWDFRDWRLWSEETKLRKNAKQWIVFLTCCCWFLKNRSKSTRQQLFNFSAPPPVVLSAAFMEFITWMCVYACWGEVRSTNHPFRESNAYAKGKLRDTTSSSLGFHTAMYIHDDASQNNRNVSITGFT